MEPTKKNDPLGTQPKNQNGQGDKSKKNLYDTGDIQEKMKKVDVKTSSPTSLLARNTMILPTEVIRSRQNEQAVKAKTETMPSSGSATGEDVILISIAV